MLKQQYKKTIDFIEQRRFELLLLSTVLVLVLPAFSGTGRLSEFLFAITISFLFIQSMVVAEVRKSRKRLMRIIVISIIGISWLKPVGFDSVYIEIIKLAFFIAFFIFVMAYLIRFISRSASVDVNVLITSVNIYLLAGINGAGLALAFYRLYPDAYNFPAYIGTPVFVHFLYYSFITMSTVGYGDITPRIPETQTLAYLISITGQLYVAIIIAFLIGKFLMQSSQKNANQSDETNE
jgi:voltage-gated potassium channel